MEGYKEMTHWSLRTEELHDPETRRALLQSLVFVLEESEPDLLTLIRKMVEMIDDAEGTLERETDALKETISNLETEIWELRE